MLRAKLVMTLLVGGLILQNITDASAAEKRPKLLDLGAKKCIPCKLMAPILDALEKEYKGKLDVEFIDVWERKNKKKAKEYGIRVIPTQVFLSAEGKELWRHEGFISKDGILEKWAELGVELREKKGFQRGEPARKDIRPKDQICYMCDGDINAKTKVTVHTKKGDVNICSPHHLFVMLSCLQKDVEDTEKLAKATDWATGKQIPATKAVYLYGAEQETGRPTVKAFAEHKSAKKERATGGGSIIGYDVLKKQELSHRCGFCDRSVYPQDAALVKVGPGLHTRGCCAHCALGVAARMGTDIEVHQPDGLTGEMIVIKTMNGFVASLEPETAVAWFGMRKKPGDKWGSAGCFHQGNFANEKNLRKWAEMNPLETGKQITIDRALMSKMAMSPEKIQKACKIGECSPR
ncbi:organomercurial lyase [Verrucomicrobiota bacterium]